ncbi:retrovirus-related pol polyprotein from transposon TNT 1-94 [Tanacetum coccineum]
MLCKPKSFYDEKHKVAIGYKNPLCLARAKQAQSALYNGHVLVTTNHTPTVIHDSKDTRKKAETLAPKPISALTVYPPNTPVKLVPRILPTKSQVKINLYVLTQLFMEFDKTLKLESPHQHLFKEVKEMEEIFDQMNNEVDKNTVDKQCAEIEKKNLLIENENLIVNCLSTQLLYDVEKSRCLDLEADMSKEAPDFNSFFKIKNLEHQIQEKDNVIRNLKVLVANVNDRSCEPYNAKDVTALIEQNDCVRVELEKVKQHYKELYDSIKITRAHTSEKTSTMLNEIESLKAQLRSKESCFTSDYVKPKVLAPGMYAIDVKPIPHPLKNNRSAHLNYISHLKESVETVREIVEEARVVKPLDNTLNYACQYTKLSQELLEYVIGTCPKSFNERDNKAPSTPVTRKKQVTFSDKPRTSSSNTQKHEVHQKVQQTNISVIPSTGVNDSTEASGSKPISNTKKNRIPAKKEGRRIRRNIGYQWRPTGKKLTLGKLDCGSQWRPTGKKFALGEMCHLTKLSVKCCSKHMTGNRSKLMNFVEKFIGSVRFGNDHLGAIMGYGDYVMGDSVISRVYYVEGLGHNLFSVGQFCDSDLEVAFRKHTCFVRDINGTDILKGSRSTNLYTISMDEMMKSSPICLLSKASKSKSWLWHRRLNHLNFGTINDLARKDLVRGLPRLKFEKDHLCSACQLGKSKKFSHRPKSKNTNMEVLHTLHMDLCGPMRVESIKGKKYILVIVDDYSRFTWVKFLRSKDETPEFVTNFLKQIQVGLNKTVRFIRTDNGTEFVNQVMSEYYEGVGIFHQKSVPRTPQQNGVVERRNRTLVEAARTMMIFSKAPMFLWAEAVATASKADIGIFVGYAPSRKGYRIYNKRTRRLMETIHVTFDEMHQSMAPVRISSGPEPVIVTPGQLKSGLAPTDKELEMLFQPMFDEHLAQSRVDEPVPSATEINAQVVPPGTSLSTTIAQDAPSTSASSSTSDIHLPVQHQEIAEEPVPEDTPIIHNVLPPSHNLVTGDPGSAQSSSGNVNAAEPNQVNYPPDHIRRWTKDHPLDNIVGNPSRPVSTRKQLASDALWCCFHTELSRVEPKNFKMAVIEDCCTLSLIGSYKVKLDEIWDELKKKLGSSKISSGGKSLSSHLKDFEDQDNPTHRFIADKALYGLKQHQGRDADHGDVKIQEEALVEVLSFLGDRLNTMAEQNVPTQPPTRTDEQIISVDILSNTNFFQAFTASANVPAIYLQQFWNTMKYNEKTGVYSCQVDEPMDRLIEVFGNGNPYPLITEGHSQSSIIPISDMVAENTKKTPQESASVKPATKRATPKKPTTTHTNREAQQESIPQEEDDDPDLELAKKMSLEAHKEKGEGEGDDADMERAIKLSLDPAFLPQGRAPVGGVTIRDPIDLSKKKRTTDQFILVRRDQTPPDLITGPSSQPDDDTSEKVIHESSSTSDSERTESETEVAAPKGNKDQDDVDTSTVTS